VPLVVVVVVLVLLLLVLVLVLVVVKLGKGRLGSCCGRDRVRRGVERRICCSIEAARDIWIVVFGTRSRHTGKRIAQPWQ
jgi:hypothetical protein